MEPINVIIWICVIVFASTAILTILHISGIRPMPNQKHGATLFKILIAEVVIIAVSAFGLHLVPNPVADCDRYDNKWFAVAVFINKFEEMKSDRCYPTDPRGRLNKGVEEFSADWEPFRSEPFAFETRIGQDEAALNADTKKFLSMGYKLENQSSFTNANGKTLYQSTWIRY